MDGWDLPLLVGVTAYEDLANPDDSGPGTNRDYIG